MMRRSVGLFSGFGPLLRTAIVISFPIRAKALDILSHRANIVALRVSKMRPMSIPVEGVLVQPCPAGRPRMIRGIGGVAAQSRPATGVE